MEKQFINKNYYFDLINAAITFERKQNRPIKAVVLSRFAYDRFEEWLKQVGILNSTNLISPLYLKKVHIKRSEQQNPKELTIEYHTKDSSDELLFDNLKQFGIENTKLIDKVTKNIKNNGRK